MAMKTLRVMTYNIRFDCPTDGPFRWAHRANMVNSMILFHKADIIGVQEVLLHQLNDLDASFNGNYKWIGAGREDGKLGGEFVPIFYKTSKFDLVESGNFWLSETPTIPGSKSWGTACTRMATWGMFHTKRDKKQLLFVNTHLDHMSEVARIEGVKLIRETIAKVVDRILQNQQQTQQSTNSHDKSNIGVIVVGDYNATENSAPVQNMLTPLASDSKAIVFQNAKYSSKTPHHGPHGTFTGFKFEVKPPILIDYMFVSSSVHVERHGVLADTFAENYPPSDHRPVVCDVTLD